MSLDFCDKQISTENHSNINYNRHKCCDEKDKGNSLSVKNRKIPGDKKEKVLWESALNLQPENKVELS